MTCFQIKLGNTFQSQKAKTQEADLAFQQENFRHTFPPSPSF